VLEKKSNLATTLSYVHGACDEPLSGETIGQCLDRIVSIHPGREALVSRHQNIRFTYRALHAEVEQIARSLMAIGVERGDRVGIWSPNCAEWTIVQYAAAKAGAILVNVNPAYRLRELEYALAQSGVSVLVTARRFRDTDYIAMLREVRPPSLVHVVLLDDWRAAPALASRGSAAEDSGAQTQERVDLAAAMSWDDFRASGRATTIDALHAREAAVQSDDAVNIQYTSGTTGSPKGATLSHHNILNNGFFIGERLHLTPADRVCLAVPLYHCFGCVIGNLAFLTHGGAVVMPGEAFDAEACLRTIHEERCTTLYGVPTMFIAQLAQPSFDSFRLDSLRTGVMAGAPCPIEVMRQAMDRMHLREITICYGMTETSPVSFQSKTDDELNRRVSTVGCIHPHVECKIIDPADGAIVPRGTPGELCSRGYLVMLGYWNNPDATAEAIDQARWMHTGDLAVMREDGYVNIVGRIKDMVIRGGDNLYPREIEEFLYTCPKIADVQVIGVPDDKYGEELCAWVQLKPGETATAEEIREFCRGQIATNKIPRYIRFTTSFPMTVTGKVQKYKMRETSIAELGLQTAAGIETA
jgi:fatty-acyl-CoA synthase